MNETSRLRKISRTCGRYFRGTAMAASAALAVLTGSMDPALAMDTDIFAATNSSVTAPNVLIILDNRSHWSQQDQGFPDGQSQGEKEMTAVKAAVSSLPGSINIGLLEFATATAAAGGGQVRFAMAPVGLDQGSVAAKNRANLTTALTTIFNNVGSTHEKTNSNSSHSYADLLNDAYNYLAGVAPYSPSSTVDASVADSNGYTTPYSLFKSPLSSNGSCATTYIVFIGNPGGQQSDDSTSDNGARLRNLPGSGPFTQIQLPVYQSSPLYDPLGYSSTCFASQPTSKPTDYAATCANYPSGCTFAGTNNTPVDKSTAALSSCSSTVVTTRSLSSSCYQSVSKWDSTDHGSLTCPAGFSCTWSAADSGISTGCKNAGQTFMTVTQTATPNAACGVCSPGTARYQVLGQFTGEAPTGNFTPDVTPYNADEWTRFMHDVGVQLSGTTAKTSVLTYTIDVYNKKPDVPTTQVLASMARVGGGKYFSANSTDGILTALKSIFAEIQAVNNTFASAALPISATNRAQNSNQVYIGMFRPDQGAHPRWFGNLKRYQVANLAGFDGLAGLDGQAAVSNTTGFVTPCGVSWWSTDSANFWFDTVTNLPKVFITQARAGFAGTAWDAAGNDDTFAKGTCDPGTQWSDLPDGPSVEKGGAAEMLRNSFATRKLYTVSSSTTGAASFSNFDTGVTGLSANATVNSNIAKFILGQDVTGEISSRPSSSARPSIHGDVIHSRPLPVDHGGGTGVVIYYGAGDGVYHAVQGSTGKELWGFVAPESYSTLQRLMDNTPLVLSPNPTPHGMTPVAGTTGRDFFFDGSTGVYQNADNTKAWIFPAMRRGGRMLYGFDVSSPAAPMLKWRRGCPNQSNDTGCTTGMEGIGQTWSTPQVAKVNGYKVSGSNAPVIIVGGGYDTCEDADTVSPPCTSPKGAAVYVIDADSGTVLKTFTTTAAAAADSAGPAVGRSVAADISLVDTNGDGIVDYGFVADTGGSLYRIDFPSDATDASRWTMKRVAYTNVTPSNSHRKFLFAPGVLPYKGDVFVAIVSGDREHPLAVSYPSTTPVVNRAYVYLDDPTRTASTDLDGPAVMSKSTSEDCDSQKVLPGTNSVGWHMDLNTCPAGVSAASCGEQGVTTALIFGGLVTFSTNRPTGSAETCSTSLGEARGYFVNLLDGSGAIGTNGTCGGTASSIFPGGGLPPSAVAATVDVNGKEETVLIGAPCKDGTSCAPIQAQKLSPPISSKRTRTYWKTNTDNK